jgi:hypothetical protein
MEVDAAIRIQQLSAAAGLLTGLATLRFGRPLPPTTRLVIVAIALIAAIGFGFDCGSHCSSSSVD